MILVLGMGILVGCSDVHWPQWPMNGFLDPTQVGRFDKDPLRREIRSTLGIVEEPEGFPMAEEPTADDLVPRFEEPPIQPGDVVDITIFELLAGGVPYDRRVPVGNTGMETLAAVGPVRFVGLTPRELEVEIKRELLEKKLFIQEPDVQVTRIQSAAQTWTAVGPVARPGSYPLPRPDYRLLEAVGAVGGLPDVVEKIVVFRYNRPPTLRIPPAPEAEQAAPTEGEENAPGADDPASEPKDVPEPSVLTMSDASYGAAGRWVRIVGQTAWGAAAEGQIDELKILEADPSEQDVHWRWDESLKDWVPIRKAAPPAPPAPDGTTPPVDEKQTAEAIPQPEAVPGPALEAPMRVIEIPIKDLMSGDSRYNIVIRPYDIINVPEIMNGEYYMTGHVNRGGAYRFAGKPITVKEAIAAAGGFDVLAWPSRADLIRRINPYEEQFIQIDLDAIFAGKAPDFYLRENDTLNVGTTAISYFMAVLRNSFRFSYGMGFVYDRNFADKDTFFAKEQLRARRRSEAESRGLPFN